MAALSMPGIGIYNEFASNVTNLITDKVSVDICNLYSPDIEFVALIPKRAI